MYEVLDRTSKTLKISVGGSNAYQVFLEALIKESEHKCVTCACVRLHVSAFSIRQHFARKNRSKENINIDESKDDEQKTT
jgi:hypothetical protein